MKTTQKPSAITYWQQTLNSRAATFRGLLRASRGHQPKPVGPHRVAPSAFPPRIQGDPTGSYFPVSLPPRAAVYEERRRARLVRSFAGAKRLPRHISSSDRDLISSSQLSREIEKFRSVPVYVRAHGYMDYLSESMRGAMAREIKQAEAQRGEVFALDSVQAHAYGVAPWGRLKKCNHGKSVRPTQIGIRTETNGKTGWDTVKWHYADYSLIRPRVRGKIYTAWYLDPSGIQHKVCVSQNYSRIDSLRPDRKTGTSGVAPTLPIHVQMRILALHTPPALHLDYDLVEKHIMLVDSVGERYHISPLTPHGGKPLGQQAAAAVREAITAFRRRRAERIVDLRTVDISHIYVSIQDSLQSGNCVPLTQDFARTMWQQIGAQGECAVRADVILAARADLYTRRACSFAACR